MKDFYWLNKDSRTFLKRGYLGEEQEPENRILEIANHAESILGIDGFASKFYSYMAQGFFSLSTPVWVNFGNKRGLPVSCFQSYIPDSMSGILQKVSEVGMMSKYGGGTSGYFGDIRARGSKISVGGESDGPVRFMELFDKTTEIVSQGCYDDKTEVLSDNGWISFEELMKDKGLKVAQVNNDNSISFVKPLNYFKYFVDEDLLLFKDSKNIDLLVTKNHNMVFKYLQKKSRNGKKNKFLKDEFRTQNAETCPLHRDVKFMNSAFAPKGEGLSFEERFLIALQADGRITKNSPTACQFNFKKKRKIDRLDWILSNLPYKVSKTTTEDGVTKYYVNTFKKIFKTFGWVELDSISYEWSEGFIQELLEWDGSRDKIKTNGVYFSIIEPNAKTVQAIGAMAGYKTFLKRDGRESEPNKSPIFSVYFSKGEYFGVEKLEKTTVKYSGHVYCVEVPSNKLLVKRGGRVVVCGNSARRGSFAAYLPVEHPDIMEFLQIREDGHPIQSMNIGVTITNKWMEEMVEGDSDKRAIWARIIRKRYESGFPYITYIDHCNDNAPQVYKDKGLKIRAQNLCNEISLSSDEENSFVCVLSSLNLARWDAIKETDAIETMIYFLDAINEEFVQKSETLPFMKAPHNFAKTQRALGMGVLGWHSLLQSKMVAFESLEAKMLNAEIFKLIRERADKASVELASIFGEPDLLKGYGRRNVTTLAIAPTTSSSFILGQVSQSIEPLNGNFFTKKLAKGNFEYRNPYLKKVLKQYDRDDQETWKSILIRGGSVQHLEFLTELERDVFKTFGEISQKEIVIQAATRQKYLDQGQSLNIMIPPKVPPKQVSDLLIEGWRLGIKGFYYQRSANPAQELSRDIMNCASCEG